MKKIIDGKRYDTEKSTLIAENWNGQSCNDLRYQSEGLYRTPNGAYFIAGEGGPMTKYGQPCGDMTCGGSNIFPMEESVALAWLEAQGFSDEIDEHLAHLVEDA